MAFVFNVKPKELGKFERVMARDLRMENQKALRMAGRQVVAELERASADIEDTGKYRTGWRFAALFNRLEVWNAWAWAIFVEKGRGKNKPQPPLAAIRPWVMRHIGDPRAVFPVARRIGKKGIEPRPVLSAPWMKRRIQSIVNTAIDKAYNTVVRRAAR